MRLDYAVCERLDHGSRVRLSESCEKGLRLRGGLQEPWGLEGSHGFQGCCKPFLNPCWLQFYIFC